MAGDVDIPGHFFINPIYYCFEAICLKIDLLARYLYVN